MLKVHVKLDASSHSGKKEQTALAYLSSEQFTEQTKWFLHMKTEIPVLQYKHDLHE